MEKPKKTPVASKVPPASNKETSIEAQLRQELTQVTSALEETDEALDEWIAETERLQGVLKVKEKETKVLSEQLEEIRLHALKLEEETRQKPKATAIPVQPVNSSSNNKVLELTRANEALREQLIQAQTWVKEGLVKIDEANARAESEKSKTQKLETDREGLLSGKKALIEKERDAALADVARLKNVINAHELELKTLRAKLAVTMEDKKEAEASLGKVSAFNTVNQFKAACADTENDAAVNWMKSVIRWSSKL